MNTDDRPAGPPRYTAVRNGRKVSLSTLEAASLVTVWSEVYLSAKYGDAGILHDQSSKAVWADRELIRLLLIMQLEVHAISRLITDVAAAAGIDPEMLNQYIVESAFDLEAMFADMFKGMKPNRTGRGVIYYNPAAAEATQREWR